MRPGARRRGRIAVIAAIAALIVLALVGVALARPGGGDSFSGGGGFGGGGGGGGGGNDDLDTWLFVIELIIRLVWLCVVYPYIGLPLVGIMIGGLIWGAYWNARNKDWNSGPPVQLATTSAQPTRAAPARADLRTLDPDFSWVLFEDFVFRLYATAHQARGNPAAMAALGPYVSAAAQAALLAREPKGASVSRVIVGAQRVYDVTLPPDPRDGTAYVGVEFESNYTTHGPGGDQTWYTVERWSFQRSAAARTRPPRPTRDFPCPNCGAPWTARDAGGGQQCAYCNQIVDNGRFDWQVAAVDLRHTVAKPPTLTHDVPERGTDVPTFKDAKVGDAWQRLLADDPAVTRDTFEARVDLVYRVLNDAWPTNDLRPARGFVSDGLYDYLTYWTSAYAAQGLRNAMDDMKITKHELAKVTRDRWYDAVTLRVFARGKDYVVDGAGHLVRGSKHKDRPYSEYWTFIRSAARRGAPSVEKTCPSCGAPLSIGMAGACDHCGVHVTAGEFDWVLSKIEQDDTYRG